jgi:hypothetical protein
MAQELGVKPLQIVSKKSRPIVGRLFFHITGSK